MASLTLATTVIILLILLVVIYVVARDWPVPSTTDGVSFTGPGFLKGCSEEEGCPAGYVCEGVCKKALGQECSSLDECTSEANYCNGLCGNGPIGGLNQACPCNEGLKCVEEEGLLVCKAEPGEPCTSNGECVTKLCTPTGIADPLYICSPGLPLGSYCTDNDECDSGNCSLNFCQYGGYTTATFGSYCSAQVPCGGYGGSNELTCKTSENKCVYGNKDLGTFCNSTDKFCKSQFECRAFAAGTGTTSVCIFPTELPDRAGYNLCPQGKCISGFTCISGVCKADASISGAKQMCLVNSDCRTSTGTGVCNNGPALRRWDWKYNKWRRITTISPGALEIKVGMRVVIDDHVYTADAADRIYVRYFDRIEVYKYVPNDTATDPDTQAVLEQVVYPHELIPYEFTFTIASGAYAGPWKGKMTYFDEVYTIGPTKMANNGANDSGCYLTLRCSCEYTWQGLPPPAPQPPQLVFYKSWYPLIYYKLGADNGNNKWYDMLFPTAREPGDPNEVAVTPGFIGPSLTTIEPIAVQCIGSLVHVTRSSSQTSIVPVLDVVPLYSKSELSSTTARYLSFGNGLSNWLNRLSPVNYTGAVNPYYAKFAGFSKTISALTATNVPEGAVVLYGVTDGAPSTPYANIVSYSTAKIMDMITPPPSPFPAYDVATGIIQDPGIVVPGSVVESIHDHDFIYTDIFPLYGGSGVVNKFVCKFKRPDGKYQIFIGDELRTNIAPTNYVDSSTVVAVGYYGAYITTPKECA